MNMTETPDQPEQEQRRKASAKFVVHSREVSSLDMREAMDTAHQSLTASLQLSFRALQVVMFVLVILYLISGFRTVEDSQTGVITFFGAIVGDDGLSPGLQTNWPPPIGGFEVYSSHGRKADIGHIFKPQIDPRLSHEQRIIKARPKDGLRPGRDGSLLTSDGDLAHMELTAEWEVIDPMQYAYTIPDALGNTFVEVALERATVHVVGQLTLEELLDKPLEELRELIQVEAQKTLNSLHCGIRISDVILPTIPEPPLTIQKSYASFDSARIEAETSVERAIAEAQEILIEAAGSNHDELLSFIEQYEQAAEIDDEAMMNTSLAEINKLLHSDEISGRVANIITSAQGYLAQIETTLGQDYRRFKSLLPAYREHPDLVIRNKWLDMYAEVLSNEDVETIFVPSFISMVRLSVTGSDSVAQLRHRNLLNQREVETYRGIDRLNPYTIRTSDINFNAPSRELSIKDGKVQGRN